MFHNLKETLDRMYTDAQVIFCIIHCIEVFKSLKIVERNERDRIHNDDSGTAGIILWTSKILHTFTFFLLSSPIFF